MRDEYIIALVFVSVVATASLMWTTRPSAIPVHPDDIFPDETDALQALEPQAAPPPPTVKAHTKKPARTPLTLTLAPKPAVIGRSAKTMGTENPSRLKLESQTAGIGRADIPKIKLFDPERGTHGFSSRRWLSEHVGIEAGIGLTGGETLREREAAAGAGLVISFD